MSDARIRSALRQKRLRHLESKPDTLVIDELGLAHAKSRVDVAVINGFIHGYEIKSDRDTLDRLGSQIDIYRHALQKVTMVAASKHVTSVFNSVPVWWGIIEAKEGPRGGIAFDVIRSTRLNLEVDPVVMAHLLWKAEVIELLTRLGHPQKDLRRPRHELYVMLSEAMKTCEITAAIREFMMKRRGWRAPPVRTKCGD